MTPEAPATQRRRGQGTASERRHPRFNHVAMSLPAEQLSADGRAEIVSFYEDVFGWQELPTLTADRHRLVLQVYTYNQFVFLIADDDPMRAPRMDHFGMQVATMEELDDMLARCRTRSRTDERVDIVDKSAEVHPGITITSFYVRYLLPMMVEVQFFEPNDLRPDA